MEDLELVFDPMPSEAMREHITRSLARLNIARTGADEFNSIGFFLKSPQGEWLGGLLGETWGGWMYVRILWLAKPLRGQGYGTKLMNAAEGYARDHGCVSMALDTHSYEAPGFYQKLGYQIFAQLEDYPPGHTKYFLRKRLT